MYKLSLLIFYIQVLIYKKALVFSYHNIGYIMDLSLVFILRSQVGLIIKLK